MSARGLPDLTLIDLPGLYQLDVKTNLPVEGVEDFLKSMYKEYIDSPECVIGKCTVCERIALLYRILLLGCVVANAPEYTSEVGAVSSADSLYAL